MWIIAILPPGCSLHFFPLFLLGFFVALAVMHIYHFTVAFHSLSFSHTISLPHAPSSFFLSLLYFTCLCIVSVCTFGNLFLVAGCNFCCYWRRLFTDSGIFRIDSSNFGYVYRNEMIMQSTQMSNSKFSLDATLFRSIVRLCRCCMWLVSAIQLYAVDYCGRMAFLCTCTPYKLCLDK